MPKNTYLKDLLLANKPELVTMKKRGAAYQDNDYNTKEPKFDDLGNPVMKYMYVFLMQDGSEVVHYANEIEEETLKAFNPSDKLQVLRMEKKRSGKPSYFVNQWSVPGSVESTMKAAPTPTVQKHVVDQAKTMKSEKTSIILQAFTKSLIESGMFSHLANNASDSSAFCLEVTHYAKELYQEHKKAVADLLSKQ